MTKSGDNSVQEFGAEAGSAEFAAAANTLHTFLDARAQGHWVKACDYLARDVVISLERLFEQITGAGEASCPVALRRLTDPGSMEDLRAEAAQADVGSVRVGGGQAFVIYRGNGDAVLAISVLKEAGRWKLATLSPVPLS